MQQQCIILPTAYTYDTHAEPGQCYFAKALPVNDYFYCVDV